MWVHLSAVAVLLALVRRRVLVSSVRGTRRHTTIPGYAIALVVASVGMRRFRSLLADRSSL
jgi:hypothetical protein